MKYSFALILTYFAFMGVATAQTCNVNGRVFVNEIPANDILVVVEPGYYSANTQNNGKFNFKLSKGVYRFLVTGLGIKSADIVVRVPEGCEHEIEIKTTSVSYKLQEVNVLAPGQGLGLMTMDHVHEGMIMAGRKTEVIIPSKVDASLAVNNTRQLFAKVPGLNIWENDGSGLQANMATRGLSPNRSWEFNVRQNGYDISADNFSYPEAYYTPPFEALKAVEFVRGAASLQFGPQFGGLLNYEMKEGHPTKKIAVESRQTGGSYGMFNTYNSVGGTNRKWNYFGFYNYRRADGWRKNSDYFTNTAYGAVKYHATDKLTLNAELTAMEFMQHQSGGLTDSMFNVDAQQSLRSRNWMQVKWVIPSVGMVYNISSNTSIRTKIFGLIGERNSVGNLDEITKADVGGKRALLLDGYKNVGMESRFTTEYSIKGVKNVLAAGFRIYNGNQHRIQATGKTGSTADFGYDVPGVANQSDFKSPVNNQSFFAENKINLTNKWVVVPGFRLENIKTATDGFYFASGNQIAEKREHQRFVSLLGISTEYDLNGSINVYANISQSYRAINFSDIRIANPNQAVDPNIKDAYGYTSDLGIRGKLNSFVTFDISAFSIQYNNRIGTINRVVNGTTMQYRTNVADALNRGIESFVEIDLLKAYKPSTKNHLSVFTSAAYVNAQYVKSDSIRVSDTKQISVKGNKVELAPEWVVRSGITYRNNLLSATLNHSYTAKQFSDASNTISTVNGNNGVIPAYNVWDLNVNLNYQRWKLGAGVNNLLNEKYFSRRAGGYPGPGVIPADARTLNVTLGVTL